MAVTQNAVDLLFDNEDLFFDEFVGVTGFPDPTRTFSPESLRRLGTIFLLGGILHSTKVRVGTSPNSKLEFDFLLFGPKGCCETVRG